MPICVPIISRSAWKRLRNAIIDKVWLLFRAILAHLCVSLRHFPLLWLTDPTKFCIFSFPFTFTELITDPTRESTTCGSPMHHTAVTTVASSVELRRKAPATMSISSITIWRFWPHRNRRSSRPEASSSPPRRRSRSWRAAVSAGRPIQQSRK